MALEKIISNQDGSFVMEGEKDRAFGYNKKQIKIN